jgi:hypothetical protein
MTKISALSDIGTSVASNDAFVLVDVSDPTTPNKKIQQQNLFLIPDGSAGTPAVRFLNDTDVGLFRPTTNTLALATGGSERLRVDSSGLVGIGTSSPSAPLNVRFDNAGTTTVALFENQRSVGGSPDAAQIVVGARGYNHTIIRQNSDLGTQAIGSTLDTVISNTFGAALHIATGSPTNAARLTVTSAGLVGIGTMSPGSALEVYATAPVLTVNSALASASSIVLQENGTTYARFRFDGNNVDIGNLYVNGATIFNAGNAERARIDSSGRLLVGTSTARTTDGTANRTLQIEDTGNYGVSIIKNSDNTYGAIVTLAKSRGTAIGSNTIVQNGDMLGQIQFLGADGTDLDCVGAKIDAEVDGTPGANDMPGRLVFSTTADGASSPTERMRITSDAYVRLASGTGGIQFNGDTAAANALDDYEEGTWTPNLTGSGGGAYTYGLSPPRATAWR